jgi:uncharacterized protein YcbX
MQGERVEGVGVGGHGVDGDRGWAVQDLATGLALTGRREPQLLFARASVIGGGHVAVDLPDGTRATSDDAGIDAVLSRWIGRDVRLWRAAPMTSGRFEIAEDFEHEDSSPWSQWDGPAGSFHDSGRVQVSFVGRASLRAWDVRRFRMNVVLEGTEEGDEQGWVGRRLQVGSASFEVVKPVDRCVMTTRPQPGGIERDLDVLRTIQRELDGNLGVGALVVDPGTVRVGDEVV